jgi:hypothetical protein
MSWFSKSTSVVEVEPPQTDEQRFQEIDAQYRAAEEEFNVAYRTLFIYAKTHPDPRTTSLNSILYARLNAMRLEPERRKLESAVTQALEVRNRLLQQRAELKLKLGL